MMRAAGGADPGEIAFAVLSDLPRSGMFHGVVSPAEDGKVLGGGGASIVGRDGVVNVCPVNRDAATGEPAVLITRGQESALRGRGPVGVDGEHIAGQRVGCHTLPRRGS